LGSNKADLILHPARLQILQALAAKPLTTQEIAGLLIGVPKSSIYRHLRALLDGGLVEIAGTRPVKGTLEKCYRLVQEPSLDQADIAGFTRADHLRYFAMYLASQLQGFSNYLEASQKPDFQADRVGYTEAGLYVTTEELDHILAGINNVLSEHVRIEPAPDSHRHKIAFITYPLIKGDETHE
jgi:DNA-binding transcriptional ArsR family regulator